MTVAMGVLTGYVALMALWAVWGSIWGHTRTTTERTLWTLAVAKSFSVLTALLFGYWWRA